MGKEVEVMKNELDMTKKEAQKEHKDIWVAFMEGNNGFITSKYGNDDIARKRMKKCEEILKLKQYDKN